MSKNKNIILLVISFGLYQTTAHSITNLVKPLFFGTIAGTGIAAANYITENPEFTTSFFKNLPDKLPTMDVLEKTIREAKTPEALKAISDKYLNQLVDIAKKNAEISKRLIPTIKKLGGQDPFAPTPSAFSEFCSKIASYEYIKPIADFKTNHPYVTYYIAAGFAYTCIYKPLRRYYHMRSEINVVTQAAQTLAAHNIGTQANASAFLANLSNYEPNSWVDQGLNVIFAPHVLLASVYSKLPTIRFN